MALVELIGIGEKEALQAGSISRFGTGEEGVFKVLVGGRFHQILIAADAIFFQAIKDLAHRKAFRYRDLHRRGRAGILLHLADKRTIVVG